MIHKLTYAVGRDPIVATDWDWFMATALSVRDHVLERWLASTRTNYISQGKRVYYLSLEFLIGRLLHDTLNNLGLVDRMRAALVELGVDYDRLRNVEHDAAQEGTCDAGWWRDGWYGWDGRYGFLIGDHHCTKTRSGGGLKGPPFPLERSD